MANPEIPTKSIYEWIPPNERAPAPISDEDPVKIGLSYLVQKLSLQSNEFRMSTSFTDQLGVTHVYGTPFYKGFVNKNLHAAVHVKNGQAFFYSTIINEDQVLATLSPPNPESMVEKSSGELRVRWGFDPTPPPQTPRYTVMGVINAFYAANMFHDITYQYGFTEQAGNFQMNNFNKGGKGGDPVVIDIQRSKETDGAEFDSTILIHELTHGLTSRLTGGAQTKMWTLMIQPCDPTFISARDAMLAADDAYYGGVHEHLIRQGFFKRGLGSISQSDPTTDNVV
ncbi:hypothetical protein BSLG_010787 [Batrachochytrium salamandrivorans]|nr:hypothetical protein BSLG_010787 [Batrachochytrium salamandrivorans]